MHKNNPRHRLLLSLFLCTILCFLCSCIRREVVIERGLQHDTQEHENLRLAIELAGFKVVNRVRYSGQQWLVAASSYVDEYSKRYYNVIFVNGDVANLEGKLPAIKTLRSGSVDVVLLNRIVTDENCDIDKIMISEYENSALESLSQIQGHLRKL